jgi:hypothetical protein
MENIDTARWFLRTHQRLSQLAHARSIAWLLLLAVTLVQPFLGLPEVASDAPLSVLETLLLVFAPGTLSISTLLILVSTLIVLPARSSLEGWQPFLLVAWWLPFMGLPLYLSYRRLRDGAVPDLHP